MSVLTSAGAGVITIPAVTGTIQIVDSVYDIIARVIFSTVVESASAGPASVFLRRLNLPIYTPSGFTCTGVATFNNNGLTGTVTVRATDSFDNVVCESAPYNGNGLTENTDANNAVQVVMNSVGLANPASRSFLKVGLFFPSYSSGSVTMTAIQINPIYWS